MTRDEQLDKAELPLRFRVVPAIGPSPLDMKIDKGQLWRKQEGGTWQVLYHVVDVAVVYTNGLAMLTVPWQGSEVLQSFGHIQEKATAEAVAASLARVKKGARADRKEAEPVGYSTEWYKA